MDHSQYEQFEFQAEPRQNSIQTHGHDALTVRFCPPAACSGSPAFVFHLEEGPGTGRHVFFGAGRGCRSNARCTLLKALVAIAVRKLRGQVEACCFLAPRSLCWSMRVRGPRERVPRLIMSSEISSSRSAWCPHLTLVATNLVSDRSLHAA